MALGWELLRGLPPGELTRLSSAQLAKYIESESEPPRVEAEETETDDELAVAPGEEGSGY